MIKAVTLDFGGTLADGKLDKESFRGKLLGYLHSLGFTGGETKLIKVINGTLEKMERARRLNREVRIEDFYSSVLSKLGIPPENHTLEYIHELYLNSFKVEAFPETEEVLEYLKGRYRLAVISNASSELPRYAIKRLGLESYFEVIVLSRDIGIRKPSPEIFKFTLQKLRLSSFQAVHVGDSMEKDVLGAKRVGMKAVWINRSGEEASVDADYVLRSISE
ncbi:MAG TPA: HAD family hydrolase, partial [Candidatus Bathyarchaeota archaeon]|nr:HAD family hydrolase [Candidatus Bathyarchaeota archaeon]